MTSEIDNKAKTQISNNDIDNNKFLDSQKMLGKSPEPKDLKDNTYIQRNLEHIKQIQEKKSKKKEDLELKKKKEQEEREKLKLQVLEVAAKQREQRQKNNNNETDVKEGKELEEPAKKLKKNKSVNPTEELSIQEGTDQQQQQQQQASKQLENYFRSRHATFLMTLQENIKKQKLIEENDRKKKDNMINKIRETLGFKNVTSKIFENDKNMEGKSNQTTHNQDMMGPKESRGKSNRAVSAEGGKERKYSSDAQQRFGDKQRKGGDTKLDKNAKEEEKVQQEKISAKDARKGISTISEEKKIKLVSKGSTNAKESDLSTSQKKIKKQISNNTLSIIKDKGEDEDDDESEDDDKDLEDDDGDGDDNDNDDDPQKSKQKGGSTKTTSKHKKKKKKLPLFPNITDMAQWKKRYKVDPNTKVFMVLGGYGDLKYALESRGWVENPDPNSPCFDLKWTLKAKDINHGSLLDHQVVNHFEKNTSITTKVGLSKSLRNLVWFANVDIDTFYPRGFDLSDPNDYEDFVEEFKSVKAESILKAYLKACKTKDQKALPSELSVTVALNVCERRLLDLDDLLEDQSLISQNMVSQEEWDILANDELNTETLAKKKHDAWLAKYDVQSGKAPSQGLGQKDGKKKPKKKKKKIAKQNSNNEEEDEKEEAAEEKNELFDRVQRCCEIMQNKYPQYDLNGDQNVWIVKPAGLSRGRGIQVFKNLVEIEDHVKGKEAQWVIQKYIENPLIVKDKKFDIRQWVLVTDWNPLTIWYYEECYIRFSAEKWDMNKLDDKFIHLTNNSIAKNSENFDNSEIEGNMWTCEEFQNHLIKTHGSDIFSTKIKPRMKQIVIWSLECVQDMVENRKNSMELYGYDFMIDENMNPWLIEINSSPAMDYSTSVTERLVKMVMEDTAKVVVDYGMSKKKKRSEIDTGSFTCIHKSKRTIEKPFNSFGLDLICEGKAIKKGH